MPGGGVLGEAAHARGEMPADNIGQGYGLKDLALSRPQGDEHLGEPGGRPGEVEVFRSGAGHVSQCTVNGADDIREADVCGRSSQGPAAVGTPTCPHETCLAKFREDRAQVRRGDVLASRDFIRRDGTIGRSSKFEGCAEGVVGPSGQSHVVSICLHRARVRPCD